ncbi:MAG TPA: 50S ribosomal protein L24 [Candidatus Nesterenkonia stercoripullorum]|uniref:Large ribosomal subunit protein uL24 n=1 Tax=Candidatus Nesterenkonia stercoripullorum TaxID=2838701 RepID=A0A9D2A6B2_9MICC|nr:50S ribosomal protein L24 [Candidatus Nesterenkonia stercoripullorum]
MAKIKKDDLVQVLSGKDKGKQGKVLQVLPKKERVLVEGVNRIKRHLRAGQFGNTEGGIVESEAPIHVSNVAVVDPESGKPTRVGHREETVERDGHSKTVRVRYAKSSGKDL